MMMKNGWHFHFTDDGTRPTENYVSVGKHCFGAKWYGWSAHSKVGTLSALLQGSGAVTLNFENCWSDGNVNVYLDGKLKSTAAAGRKRKVVTFSFTPGSILSLKDEHGNAVVMLNSITFDCTGRFISDYSHIRNFNKTTQS